MRHTFVLERPLYTSIRDESQTLFENILLIENAILGSLDSLFQLHHQS